MCLRAQKIRNINSVTGRDLEVMSKLDRDARLPAFIDAPDDAGSAFRELKVGVFCTGSVGMHLASHTARLAPDTMVIVDRAKLKPTSVLTHPIHPRDLGRSKASVAGELAKAVSPGTQVLVFEHDLAELPTSVLAGLDYIFLASDNAGAEVTLSQRAPRLGIPVIQAAVYGRSLSAVVRAVDGGDDGSGPGLCCGLLAGEWDALDRGEVFSCAPDDRAAGSGAMPTTVPTASVSHLCSLSADLAFNELFRRVAGLGKPGGNRTVEYCGYNHKVAITELNRRNDCPLDHCRDRVVTCSGDLSQRTPRELMSEAGYGDDDRISFSVEGHFFAAIAWCQCDTHPVVGRFLENGATAGVCSRCGTERSAHPMHRYSDVPAKALTAGFDQTLASLGAIGATAIRVCGERGAVQFVAAFAGAEAGAGTGVLEDA